MMGSDHAAAGQAQLWLNDQSGYTANAFLSKDWGAGFSTQFAVRIRDLPVSQGILRQQDPAGSVFGDFPFPH